ncbi:hypothetical protein KJ953_00990 [Patescibacteria group bacterium]|nr:hypothetical protein [Patescibacteria group bacterium]MBU1256500.1 hypothetical protein [Patescibacteria group bacterium]MBU1457823.1 hypothetical protein [Patescibacteria group bacterium]
MALTLVDKKWIKGEIMNGVLEGIHEVIMPALERLDGKIDKNAEKIDNLEGRFDNFEVGLGNIERKLDTVIGHYADK